MNNTLKITIYLLLAFLFYSTIDLSAEVNVNSSEQSTSCIFQVEQPDFKLSPYTGMTRKHWKDAALYLLKGAFSYVKTLDDPILFPKQEGKSYPRNPEQVSTVKLEGLCRTLFIAAPLLKEDSNLVINGIKVAEYYRHQLCLLVNPQSTNFIKLRDKQQGTHQNLVEFGALSLSLFSIPEVLWKPLSKEQKDALAATLLSYADGPTISNNWRYFNVFIFSYFKSVGYPINDALMQEYLQKTLLQYSGDGWYNDSPAYDYYSMWAFQMYGMLWSHFYGKKNCPEIAKQLADNFKPLKDNYPYLFSRKGEMIMWGRSMSYRFGAIVPFPLMGLENATETNYGWMRRISSGCLLQFLQNPDYLKDHVPTLGFYGAFEPTVQRYSCRGSAFWCGKAFLGLLVPENNPFWQSVENEGAWEKELQQNTVSSKLMKGSNILITDYPNIGASELRAWCNVHTPTINDQYRGSENYNRLSYNSAFPWQADGKNGEVAMSYVVKNKSQMWEAFQQYTFKKYENGIYYRDVELLSNPNVKMRLADIPLANGILRVDKNISTEPTQVRLGHYALSESKLPIKEQKLDVDGYEVFIVDNGVYQLALVKMLGWEGIQFVHAVDLNPVAKKSTVINLYDNFSPDKKEKNYVTLMLWKKSGENWTKDELMPVRKIKYLDNEGGLVIYFKNRDVKTILY